MLVSRVSVFTNEKKDVARRVREEVLSFLKERGIATTGKPDLVITIGGDGTVLFNKLHYGVPFFSIGSSTSFICQADFSDFLPKLERVVSRLRVERRLLLECEIDGKKLPPTLNEIGIRNPAPRVLSLHLEAGKRHFAFRADGILFSTPTGSMAYCYSCGGSEMPLSSKSYQAVAISPFRRLFAPLVLGSRKECTLRMNGTELAQVFIDGQEMDHFRSGQTLKVRASKTPFLFARV